MSAESSGGVRSRVILHASRIDEIGSDKASRISSLVIVIVLGSPARISRPLTSIPAIGKQGIQNRGHLAN